jgi:hypothetical protein
MVDELCERCFMIIHLLTNTTEQISIEEEVNKEIRGHYHFSQNLIRENMNTVYKCHLVSVILLLIISLFIIKVPIIGDCVFAKCNKNHLPLGKIRFGDESRGIRNSKFRIFSYCNVNFCLM